MGNRGNGLKNFLLPEWSQPSSILVCWLNFSLSWPVCSRQSSLLYFFKKSTFKETIHHHWRRYHQRCSLNEHHFDEAKAHFYKKATKEIERFSPPSQYQHISQKKDHILFYTGRILSDDSVSSIRRATQAMLDLSSTTFEAPLLHNNSPLTFSIFNGVHWHHPSADHSETETVSRKLLKSTRISCERCYLMKKAVGGSWAHHKLMIHHSTPLKSKFWSIPCLLLAPEEEDNQNLAGVLLLNHNNCIDQRPWD